jgi:hypothetical protein
VLKLSSVCFRVTEVENAKTVFSNTTPVLKKELYQGLDIPVSYSASLKSRYDVGLRPPFQVFFSRQTSTKRLFSTKNVNLHDSQLKNNHPRKKGTKLHFKLPNGGKKACFVRWSWWGLNPRHPSRRRSPLGMPAFCI